jgi:hypothetical protein
VTKIILTVESDDPQFVSRVMRALRKDETAAVPMHINLVPPQEPATVEEQSESTPAESPAGAAAEETVVQPFQPAAPAVSGEKPPRKPRSDAGKPRGAYKKSDNVELAEQLREQKNAAAPEQAITPAPESAVPAAAAPAATGALTIEDARAALDRINKTAALGMAGCIAHLNSFGYARVSDLPKDKYAEFIAAADAKIEATKK